MNTSAIQSFLSRLRSITFLQRIFAWRSVKELLIDATADMQLLTAQVEELKQQNTLLTANTARKHELDIELATTKTKLEQAQEKLQQAQNENTIYLAEENNRRKKYEADITALTMLKEQVQQDRSNELQSRNNDEITRLKNLKATWHNHETNVKGLIKSICQKHTIEYIDKVPFKGEPDNTLLICNEYIIFDAKSPATDDLNNFPAYLKAQAEAAKKYTRQENVKTDIFLVVPANTLEKINTFSYHLGDYNVYIIATDALEPVILNLKKIEDYEFAEQLSPEERDNICRILGKFAHLTKRRIQIDSFFAKQFIELAYKTEAGLPADVLEKMMEFERAEKLNPPIEKRAKAINTRELEQDTNKLITEAAAKGIYIDDAQIATGLNNLPLYITTQGQ